MKQRSFFCPWRRTLCFLAVALVSHTAVLSTTSALSSCGSVSSSSGPRKAHWWSPRGMDGVGLASNIGAGIAASFELVEDWESIGHHHGILLLGGSKVCREVNVLREAIVEQVKETTRTKRRGIQPKHKVFSKCRDGLLRLLSNTFLQVGLALAALAAALVEVLRDVQPGGHHGAVLLATNELLELLQASRVARGRVLRLCQHQLLRLVLAGGATTFALVETSRQVEERVVVGAHHGVLLLGISNAFRCIGKLRESLQKEKKE